MRILQLTRLFCASVKKAVRERIGPAIDHRKPNHTKAQRVVVEKTTGPVLAVGMSTSLFGQLESCNMCNCTQPRLADHNSKSAPRQMPTPQGYSSSSSYAGSGALSSMYMGVTPYAASPFNGTSMPPYDDSAYRYNYNSRLPGGNPYRPLQLSAWRNWCIVWFVLADGTIRFAVAHCLGCHEPSQKKDGTRENDCECPKCGNVNFSFRTVCKPGSQVAKPAKSSKAVPEGSWKCDKCNNINYPFRTKCNR